MPGAIACATIWDACGLLADGTIDGLCLGSDLDEAEVSFLLGWVRVFRPHVKCRILAARSEDRESA